MKTLRDYCAEVRSDPRRLWFKRKRYGWGWTPARWQGWVAIIVYTAGVIGIFSRLDASRTRGDAVLGITIPMLILTAALVRVCYLTSETPRWQWGREDER
jgi:hypothetical protein